MSFSYNYIFNFSYTRISSNKVNGDSFVINAKESLNKQELKAWGLLKSREDYDLFYRITGMLSDQKISEYGKEFLTDLQVLTDIVKIGKRTDAKIYIDTLTDRKRKIVAADTYFTILRTYLSLKS